MAQASASTPTAKRVVDLSGLGSAFLDFDYRTDMASTESVTIAVSEDGILWTALATITGTGTDSEEDKYQAQEQLRINNNFLLATTEIRIIANLNAGSGSAFYIDNIKISDKGILPNAPRAEWRFDEASWNIAGDVKDSSGNDYHGLAKNSSPVAGKVCNAADLSTDSPADLIDVNYLAADGLGDFTFMFWALPQSIDPTGTDYATPFSIANDTVAAANEATFFWIDNTTAQFWFKGGTGGDTSLEETTSTLNEFTTWRHYTWTRSGTGTATETHCLYENGVLLGGACTNEVTPAQLGTLNVDPGGFIIGQEQDSVGLVLEPTQDWQGYIDEFLVFEGALTLPEIQAVYDNHNAGKNWDAAPGDPSRDCSVPIELKLEYRFEDTAPAAADGVIDETANAHDATADLGSIQVDTTVTSALVGTPGTCGYRDFDGSTNANVIWDTGVAASELDLSSDFSLAAWVQPQFPVSDTGGTQYGVISKGDNYELSLISYMDTSPSVLRANMRLRWVDGNGTTHTEETSDLELETDGSSWYHIAAVYNDDQFFLYVAGSQVAGGSLTVPLLSGVEINTDNLEIGQISAANNFEGFIDEVRIYSGALSPTEVAAVAADTHGCVATLAAEFRFDEADWGAGIDVIDFSGNGHNGVAFNSDPVQGFVCNAADLTADGIGDYLVLGEGALNGLTDFSVAFWGRSANTGTAVAMTAGDITTPQDFVVSFDNPTSLTPEISNADQLTVAVSSISDYTWRFYAWTRNGGTQCLYEGNANKIDAINETCESIGNDITALSVSAGGFVLGQLSGTQVGNDFDAANDWEGLLDEVLIFNNVKGLAELTVIRDNHVDGKNWDAEIADSARLCSPVEPDPLIEIRFDEQAWAGTGDIVDSEAFASNGVATNSNPIAGKVCNAADLSATGTGDYLSLDADALNGRGSFTMMFWGKPNAGFSGAAGAFSGANGSTAREIVMRFDAVTTADPELFGAEILEATLASGDELNNSEWHHYTWRRNEDENCFYQDGVSLGCSTGINTSLTSVSPGGFIVGQEQGSVGGNFSADGWEGLIDELIIFNQILGDGQIVAIYNNHNLGLGWDGSARVCQDPVAHYKIDHAGSSGATVSACGGIDFTVEAHQIDDSPAIPAAGTTITMSCTSVPAGACAGIDWSASAVNGTFTEPNLYTFSGDESSIVLHMDNITANTTYNIDITDGISTETANNNEDPDLIIAAGSMKFYTGGYTMGTVDTIGNQVSYKPSNTEPGLQALSIVSLASGGCANEPSFENGINEIRMFYQCINPVSNCNSNTKVQLTYPIDAIGTTVTIAIAGLDLADPSTGIIGTSISPYFDGNSEAAVSFYYQDAGEIRLYAGDPNSPLNGNNPSNNFVVRPFGFLIEAKESDNTPAPSGVATTTSTAFVEAGEAFKVSLTAVGWEEADDDDPSDGSDADLLVDGDDGHPDSNADLSGNPLTPNFGNEISPASTLLEHTLTLPLLGSTGALSGTTTFTGFSASTKEEVDIEWNEVGAIELDTELENYLDPGESVRGAEVEVGRFIPAQFLVAPGTINNRSDRSCSPISNFTYLGENLELNFTLTAQSINDRAGAATITTTENYDTSHGLAHLDNYDSLTDDSLNIAVVEAGVPLANTVSGSATPTWAAGVSNVTSTLIVSRASNVEGGNEALAGPFTAADFAIDPIDPEDGVSASAQYDTDVVLPVGDDHIKANAGSTELRYGRLSVDSVYGPETEQLSIPLQLQYWDGDDTDGEFIITTDDNCTAYDTSLLGLAGVPNSEQGNIVSVPSVTLSQPGISILFSEGETQSSPTANPLTNVLYAEIPGADWSGLLTNGGSIDIFITSPTWLQYDWFDGSNDLDNPGTPDGNAEDPRARVTFGIYRGHDRVIYWEEIQ